MPRSEDERWMDEALRRARMARDRGEVPIGAVIVREGRLVASGYNLRETSRDPSAHAEMIAIRRAARRLGNWRLSGTTLYVTLEPCIMCMGGIILSRIDRLVFGCHDPKGGGCGSLYDLSCDPRLNHRLPVTSGVRGEECSLILSDFFRSLRETKRGGGRSAT